MVTDGELVLADGSGMPTLLLQCYTCQSCVESYLSQILVFLELLLLGAPILWFPVLEPRSRKTNRHALCGPSNPGSSGAEPLEKKNACSSCSPQCAASTPYLCRVHLSWDFTSFHGRGLLLALRPHSIGVATLYWKVLDQLHLEGAHPKKDHDLLDNTGHASRQLWWMNQSYLKTLMCFRNENSRRDKTVPIVRTPYWPLDHTVLFWNLFKCVFLFFFKMSSWRAGTVFQPLIQSAA